MVFFCLKNADVFLAGRLSDGAIKIKEQDQLPAT